MSYLFQPFSLGTNESIEDTFIAPPDNVQESRDAMEEVERYKVSRNSGSSCTTTLSVATAAQQLQRRLLYDDFQKCGILPESVVTLPELLTRLRTSARHYDEEMLRRIYAALSSFRGLRESCITGRIFIEAYMKRRRELLAVLESARGELDGAELMLQQAEAHLSSLSMDPNASLIEESKLTAQVACLQNLDSGSPAAAEGGKSFLHLSLSLYSRLFALITLALQISSPWGVALRSTDIFKVHLECQQQVIETAAVRVERGVCFYNEVFSFEISSREGDLRLCLIKVDPNSGREELVGDCSVLLQDLSDQKKREFVKEIWGHAGEIVLSCQWIFSKRALYEQYLHEFTVRREAKIRELSDYQEELDKLNRPFCIVDSGGGGMWNCVKVIPEVLSRQMEDLREYLKLPGWLVSLMACIVALDDLKTQAHMH
ncbi:Multi-pass transmembrane protein, related [Eimeria acervulina]|uniref:Multi-pass transmembrane protein, related n=1 Tax=Eimeria acervulina TaxID=5801 RepID=U6GWP0_EIMAC|nr:Multi-pass transmembrane protein, related [Eimeria acervulina]CDI82979.1 Multi-pass transmembrane protein, related [Eimeria acervulina]